MFLAQVCFTCYGNSMWGCICSFAWAQMLESDANPYPSGLFGKETIWRYNNMRKKNDLKNKVTHVHTNRLAIVPLFGIE